MMRTMRILLLATTIWMGAAIEAFSQTAPWVTVYYAGWDKWNAVPVSETDLDYSCGTHWVSFTHGPGNGSFSSADWDATREKAFVDLAHAAGKKAIYGTGGWGADYTGIVSNVTASVAFVVNIMDTYGYDGIDLDWEPIPSGQATNFKAFVMALKAAKPNITLTVACYNYDAAIVACQQYIDQMNLMTYDMSGSWTGASWHNSAIFAPTTGNYGSIDQSINKYLQAGVPASKLGFGIELYAYIWSGVNAPKQTGYGNIQNTIPYYSIMQNYYQKGTPFKWDPEGQAGYFSGYSEFISMDYETTMVAKAQYCRDKGLGGVIVYEAGVANVPGFTPTPDRVMKEVKHAFLGGPALPPLPYIPPPLLTKGNYTVYTDAIDKAWFNTSWVTNTVGAADPTNASNKTIKVDYSAWTGLRFHHGTGWSDVTSIASDTLVFDVYPVTNALAMTIQIEGGGDRPVTASANKWTHVKVPCPPASFSWFYIENNTASSYSAYFDNIRFTAQSLQDPATGTFTCTPDTLPASGGTVTLQWTSQNATTASISPTVGTVTLSGSINQPVTSTTTYTLTLSGPGGSSTYAAKVVVRSNLPVPSAPAFLSPQAGATDQPTTVTLRWRQAAGATKYHAQLTPDSLFASRLVNDSTLTDTLRQVTGLVEGSRYYRRVRAGNAAGWSSFSVAAYFTTLATVSKTPDPPTFIAPSPGAVVQPDSVMVKWTSAPGSRGYHLQASTDSLFAATVLSDSSLIDTIKIVSRLTPGTVYFSRVRAKNAVGWGAYSAAVRFNVTAQALAAPTLVSPSNGASQQPLTVSLSWIASPGSTMYDIEMALDPNIATRIVVDSTTTTTSVTVGPLNRKTRYYWRVRARNSQVTSLFSPAWTFRTVVTAPKPPKNLSIAAAVPPSNQLYTLLWAGGEDADQYRVQISEDPLFTGPFVDTTCTDSSMAVPPIVPRRSYYARVRSENIAGTSGFSTLLLFSVNDVGIQTAQEFADFELYQNYPNPFNPSTTIEFDIPVQSEASIRIYSTLGMEVASLLAGPVSAGRHSVVWNATGFSSGTYFCRFQAGSYVVVRRLILLK
jgi:hypothetical protein